MVYEVVPLALWARFALIYELPRILALRSACFTSLGTILIIKAHTPVACKTSVAKMWLTLRVYFFGSQIENINVFCLLRLVNYCIFFLMEDNSTRELKF